MTISKIAISSTKLAIDRRTLLTGASALGIFALASCGDPSGAGSSQPSTTPTPTPTPPTSNGQIRGFNQNWSIMPALSTGNMVNLMKRLRPGMIRYPGGTVTHGWDWQAGQLTSRPSSAIHPIGEVKQLSDALGAQVVVVLDIVYRSLDDQLAMLRELRRTGLQFRHVELGNELYLRDADYAARFPTGAEYGAEANRWAAAVKAEFPNVAVAALLLAREAGANNPRGQSWNTDVLSVATNNIDAWTFHLYIPIGGTASVLMDDYRAVTASLPLSGKPVWITEYGNKNEGDPTYLSELLALADAVEAQSGVTIALNHQMIGGGKNKMDIDGVALNAEGEAFVKRVGG